MGAACTRPRGIEPRSIPLDQACPSYGTTRLRGCFSHSIRLPYHSLYRHTCSARAIVSAAPSLTARGIGANLCPLAPTTHGASGRPICGCRSACAVRRRLCASGATARPACACQQPAGGAVQPPRQDPGRICLSWGHGRRSSLKNPRAGLCACWARGLSGADVRRHAHRPGGTPDLSRCLISCRAPPRRAKPPGRSTGSVMPCLMFDRGCAAQVSVQQAGRRPVTM